VNQRQASSAFSASILSRQDMQAERQIDLGAAQFEPASRFLNADLRAWPESPTASISKSSAQPVIGSTAWMPRRPPLRARRSRDGCGRQQRTPRVVFVRDRRPEQRHEAVAEELVHGAFIAMHLGERQFEEPVEHDEASRHGRCVTPSDRSPALWRPAAS
jgi:hypothetical protein